MYVPHEIGFWSEPDMRAFAKAVRDPNAGAGISRLREYIMVRDFNDGRLPDHSREKIAAIMEVPPKTCTLDRYFKALEQHGFLRRHRKTYYVPNWKKSPAGKYCESRLEDAKYKKAWREKKRAEELGEGGEKEGANLASTSQEGDATLASSGQNTVCKDGRPPDSPPGAPSGGGESDADARFRWFWDLYPKRRNPPKCKLLLAKMDAENWEQLRHALPRHREIYMSRNMRYVFPADKYLAMGTFWELARETPRKSESKTDGKKQAKESPEAVRAKAFSRLMAILADPDWPEKKKQLEREFWEKTYGDRPWEEKAHPHHHAKAKAA